MKKLRLRKAFNQRILILLRLQSPSGTQRALRGEYLGSLLAQMLEPAGVTSSQTWGPSAIVIKTVDKY